MQVTVNHLSGEIETVEVKPLSRQHEQRLKRNHDMSICKMVISGVIGAVVVWLFAVLSLV